MASWKSEFDSKYRKLHNMGSVAAINDSNDVLLRAIASLDKLIRKHSKKIQYGGHRTKR